MESVQLSVDQKGFEQSSPFNLRHGNSGMLPQWNAAGPIAVVNAGQEVFKQLLISEGLHVVFAHKVCLASWIHGR
jgi:hypothetical protein